MLKWFKARLALLRKSVELARSQKFYLTSGLTISDALERARSVVKVSLASETGSISVGMLESIFVGVILLVILITYLWQQGLPEIISATGNTTALENAGATANQLSWIEFIGGAIVIFLLIGVLVIGIRMASAGGARSGGGGRRWRRRRR